MCVCVCVCAIGLVARGRNKKKVNVRVCVCAINRTWGQERQERDGVAALEEGRTIKNTLGERQRDQDEKEEIRVITNNSVVGGGEGGRGGGEGGIKRVPS